MAKLAKLPARHIIAGFKGTLDFYLWKGMPCARKWPTWRPRAPSPEEKQAQETFAYSAHIARDLPEYVKQQYRQMAAGTSYTWKDLFIRSYVRGIRY